MSYDRSLIGKTASAYAPASTGNVSVGFDVLGAALERVDGKELGDKVYVTFAEKASMTNSGDYAYVCPEVREENLAWQAYLLFLNNLKQQDKTRFPAVSMELVKSLPVGSGLGSSACSVVAALTALNRLFDNYYSEEELLVLMGEVEAGASGDIHFDNVAPSYFGGLQLMSPHQQNPIIHLPTPSEWFWVMAFPGFSLPTKEAREALPKQYDKKDVITNAQQLACFVAYLYQQNSELAAQTIKDIVAEPYRAPLIKGFAENKKALLEQGALAVGISGAGPTLFALTPDADKAEQFKQHLEQHYLASDGGFVHVCKCAVIGAKHINL